MLTVKQVGQCIAGRWKQPRQAELSDWGITTSHGGMLAIFLIYGRARQEDCDHTHLCTGWYER